AHLPPGERRRAGVRADGEAARGADLRLPRRRPSRRPAPRPALDGAPLPRARRADHARGRRGAPHGATRRPRRMRRILVTGAGGPAGVNFVRSLRAAETPYYIVGTDIDPFHLEWPELDAAYLAPRCDDPGYVDFLNRLIEHERIEFVHPQPDSEVAVLSEARDRLAAPVFLPARETVRTLQDKYRSAEIWARHGIQATRSFLVRDRADLEAAAAELGLPFWLRATHGAGGTGSTPVETIEVAEHWMA